MKNTHAAVRGARAVLAFHRELARLVGSALENPNFSASNYNGKGSYFPGSTYTAEDMLNVSNFSATNALGRDIWLEAAVFLNKSGIPLATVSSSLYEDPILFLVEQDREKILKQIREDLEKLAKWS